MRRVTGGRLVKAMLFGLIGTAVGVGLDLALAYARRDWANPLALVLVGGLAGVSGVFPLLQEEQPRDPAPERTGYGLPLAVAALVVLVLCGGGAVGATVGAQRLVTALSDSFVDRPGSADRESGIQVLVEPKTGTAGKLALTVTGVEVTAHFTKVAMSATNHSRDALHLPVEGFCQLTTQDGTTLRGNGLASTAWPDNLPSNQTVRGTVVFTGALPRGTSALTITFAQIFGTLEGPSSIAVSDVKVSVP